MTLMAELGHGLFGAPGIEGHRQGLDALRCSPPAKCGTRGQTLTLVSEDPQAGLRSQSEIALDASGVLSVRHGVTTCAPAHGRWIAWRTRCRSPNALAR
ncbi:hypothetical protein MJ585_00980 [Klebsiella pneumoniae]|nr:hypothetical protein MJ585_00980 [Klebsiella pneumoniae]